MKDELSSTYLNKNPLIREYFKKKVNLAVNLAKLKKQDYILDFGCGEGWLKNKLRKEGYLVVGYDITPEHTEIKDYRKISPTKIFALDVFGHIPKEEIIKIIKDFKKMNNNFELIVSIPTENLISRKARKLLGKSERVSGHITSLKEISKILNSEFKRTKRINFFGISYIAKFKSN